ncbi:MAG: hypothetical protein ACREUF_05365, partial [Solimonas sp.]
APQLATWLPKVVFPDAVPLPAGSQPGSVLDDILKGPPTSAAPPTSPPQIDRSSGDPLLDRLLKGN